METQARYVIVGFFTLLIAAAGFVFVYWLHGVRGRRQRLRSIACASMGPSLDCGQASPFSSMACASARLRWCGSIRGIPRS